MLSSDASSVGETEQVKQETAKGRRPKLGYFKDAKDGWLQVAYIIGNTAAGVTLPLFVFLFSKWASALAGGTGRSWKFWIGLMLLSSLGNFFAVALGTTCSELTAERQLRKIRHEYLREVMRQDVAYFDQYDATALASELNANCASFREARGMRNGLVFMYIGLTLACLGFSFWFAAGMTGVCICTMPIIILAGWWAIKAEVKAHADTLRSLGEAGAFAQESLGAIRTVKAFGLESTMVQRFTRAVKSAFDTACKGAAKSALGFGVYWGLIFVSAAFGFWYGAKLISKGLDRSDIDCSFGSDAPGCFSAATATAVFVDIVMAAYFVGKIIPMFSVRGKAKQAVSDIVKLITKGSCMDPYTDEGLKADTIKAAIELRNVAFAYPSRPDTPVFRCLNLQMKAGTSVALVGGSGCGKSTIIQLIERFYDPTAGEILLDGRPLKDYNLSWLRDNMALVSQEPKLFASTIAENIQVGRESATRDEIIAAAKEANAHNFIEQLPDGYDTWVGEGGGQLSGGQKQRIAIARAIIRNPRILILDEATSALDNESEKLVQETLDRVVAGSKRTTIIIAHRLTTVRNADAIIVLDNASGKGAVVAEEGTHEELLRIENGLYAALVSSQTCGDDQSESLSLASQYSRELSQRQQSLVSLHSKFTASRGSDGAFTPLPPQSSTIPEEKVYRRIMSPAMETPASLVLGTIGSLINGAIWPVFGIAFSHFMDAYAQKTGAATMHEAKRWALVMVGIGVANAVGYWLQMFFMTRNGEVNASRLRMEAYEKMLHQEGAFYDWPKHSTGILLQMLTTDISLVRNWTGTNLGLLIAGGSCLIVGTLAALAAAWKLGLVAFAGLVVMIPASYMASVLTSTGGKLRRDTTAAESEETQQPSHILNEVVLNIRTVYAYNLQRQMNKRFTELTDAEYYRGRKRALVAGLTNGAANSLRLLIFTGVFYYGGHMTVNEEITPTAMMQGSLCILFAAMQLGRTFISSVSSGRSRECATSVLRLIDRRPQIDETAPDGYQLQTVQDIAFEHVAFTYPTRPLIPIYRDVSFEIPKGKVIALVGASGCGKSTAVQLLERFYDVSEAHRGDGLISINGKDLRDYNVQSLRSRIGLVSQEPTLFWGSVEENIFFGKPDASLEDVKRACQMANAWDFIQTLPDGIHTDVGRGGSRLSGGQKQRIAIARALLRNPELLILDEATSALDNESERVVQQALSALLEDKAYTTIIIAHRLSTIRKADAIVVFVNSGMQGSRVAEVGTHDELMKKRKGIYRGLVRIANAS